MPARNVRARPASPAAPALSTCEVEDLERRQRDSLGLTTRESLKSTDDVERFLARVGMALRYQATPGIPLASLRSACGPANSKAALTRSIALTNHLLESSIGVEVNVVAGRIGVVHRSLVPALYKLVRRDRLAEDLEGLSLNAQTAHGLIAQRRAASVGDVRRLLGPAANPKHDPAYAAVAELQRAMLVDRGPFEMPASGIPYLSREGYPYRVFHQTHRALVTKAASLTVAAATDVWLTAYLQAAIFASPRHLSTLFRTFVTAAEITSSLERLGTAGRISWCAGRAGRLAVSSQPGGTR